MKRFALFVLCLALAFSVCCLADEVPDDQLSIYQFGVFYVGLPADWSGIDLDGLYVFSAKNSEDDRHLVYIQAHDVDGDAIRKIGLNAFYDLYYDRLALQSLVRDSYAFYDTVADVYSGLNDSGEQIGGSVLLYNDAVLILTVTPAGDSDLDTQIIYDILAATIPCDRASMEDLMGAGSTPEPAY